MRILLAIRESQFCDVVEIVSEVNVVAKVDDRQDIFSQCLQTTPDILIVSDQLKGENHGTLDRFLSEVKEHFPDLRILYLTNTSSLENTTMNELEVEYVFDLMELKERMRVLTKISSTHPKWDIRRILSITLIIIGLSLLGLGLKPLWELKTQMDASISEWEALKQESVIQETPDETRQDVTDVTSEETASPLFGLIRLTPDGNPIGLRKGISEEVLSQGAGFDPVAGIPGQYGNAVVYGHREGVFWDLKHLKIGDVIQLETLQETVSFQVVRTFVTNPSDEVIYASSETPVLTLVTCYPFVFMGPTPERFIVVAERIQ